MELKAIEASRVVHLTTLERREGQVFLPTAFRKIVDRYSFQKVPGSIAETADAVKFEHGLWMDTAIAEFTIYADGLVAGAGSPTPVLESFLDDVIQWAAADLGLVEVGIIPRERYFESSLSVEMDLGSSPALGLLSPILDALAEKQAEYGIGPFEFGFGGIAMSADPTLYATRKPAAFTLNRRIGAPHAANIFHSSAPLKTADHLALLRKLETALG